MSPEFETLLLALLGGAGGGGALRLIGRHLVPILSRLMAANPPVTDQNVGERVAKNETRLDKAEIEIERLRKHRHEFVNEMRKSVAADLATIMSKQEPKDDENR